MKTVSLFHLPWAGLSKSVAHNEIASDFSLLNQLLFSIFHLKFGEPISTFWAENNYSNVVGLERGDERNLSLRNESSHDEI